jgi:hypothetical protein
MDFIIIKNLLQQRQPTEEPAIESFKNTNDAKSMITSYILPLMTTGYAMYLGWNCTKNLKNNPFKRFFWMLIYFMFSGLYLIYYFIAYYMAGKSCFD